MSDLTADQTKDIWYYWSIDESVGIVAGRLGLSPEVVRAEYNRHEREMDKYMQENEQ